VAYACGVLDQELHEAVKKVAAGDREPAAAEMRRVRREVVDLHGEMVLLLNYSAVNYTGSTFPGSFALPSLLALLCFLVCQSPNGVYVLDFVVFAILLALSVLS
jgi:hypothetical protein